MYNFGVHHSDSQMKRTLRMLVQHVHFTSFKRKHIATTDGSKLSLPRTIKQMTLLCLSVFLYFILYILPEWWINVCMYKLIEVLLKNLYKQFTEDKYKRRFLWFVELFPCCYELYTLGYCISCVLVSFPLNEHGLLVGLKRIIQLTFHNPLMFQRPLSFPSIFSSFTTHSPVYPISLTQNLFTGTCSIQILSTTDCDRRLTSWTIGSF